jgi:hypothetical protein
VATRAIVTSQPDVACDLCGRRLLRGEQPDTFLVDGEARTVCELCAPRAAYEGWLRESEAHDLTMRPARRRRGVSLLGRLRGLGDTTRPQAVARTTPPTDPDGARESAEEVAGRADEWGQTFFDGALQAPPAEPPAELRAGGVDPSLAAAIDIFNAGEQPRRVAGVARSLGEPSVTVRPLEGQAGRFTIVVAWELCWYRYEIDLTDETAGARLAGKGSELGELAEQDRQANAAADERGELALIA